MSTKEELHISGFSAENRKKYLSETTLSLNALLDDAFGEDLNQLRSVFPVECTRDKIKIIDARVSLSFINGADVAVIEVQLQISFDKASLGEYQSVYNLNGVLEDESFFFE
jgi:hypothetical protein